MGVSVEQLDAIRASLIEAHAQHQFEVWPEHWHALQVFRAMATQWHALLGFGEVLYQGLRYESLPIVLAAQRRTAHRPPLRDLLDQLQVLECAALDILNAR